MSAAQQDNQAQFAAAQREALKFIGEHLAQCAAFAAGDQLAASIMLGLAGQLGRAWQDSGCSTRLAELSSAAESAWSDLTALTAVSDQLIGAYADIQALARGIKEEGVAGMGRVVIVQALLALVVTAHRLIWERVAELKGCSHEE